MFIPIFIRQDNDDYSWTPLTKIEKVWAWLVVAFCLEVIISGIFMVFKKEIGFDLMLGGVIGGFVMNMIMMVLSCSKYNAT